MSTVLIFPTTTVDTSVEKCPKPVHCLCSTTVSTLNQVTNQHLMAKTKSPLPSLTSTAYSSQPSTTHNIEYPNDCSCHQSSSCLLTFLLAHLNQIPQLRC